MVESGEEASVLSLLRRSSAWGERNLAQGSCMRAVEEELVAGSESSRRSSAVSLLSLDAFFRSNSVLKKKQFCI